jgi:putative alpha-1,2-mannosidase
MTPFRLDLVDSFQKYGSRIWDGRSPKIGYYRTHLQNGIIAEMSSSQHAGLMKYTYPAGAPGKYVLVNVSHYVPANDDNVLG